MLKQVKAVEITLLGTRLCAIYFVTNHTFVNLGDSEAEAKMCET